MYRRAVGSRGKGKPYRLAQGTFLIACILCDAIASESSNTVTIYAQVKPKVVISATDDAFSWEISPKSPGIYTKTQIFHIKANTDWQLTVKENDSDSKGCMREWLGNGYREKRLSRPMKISAESEVILPSDKSIVAGKMTGNKGTDVQVIFIQEVTADDLPLREGAIYRKCIVFIGSPSHK